MGKHFFDFAIDRDGWLWIEGMGFGIIRFKIENGRVANSVPIELRSKAVVFAESDSRGWMWLGEDDGLEIYDGVALHHYDTDNGLIWNDCNAKGITIDRDGSVWLATSGGISHFVADRLPTGIPSKPILTDIQYGQNHLSKSYAHVGLQRDPLIFSIASMNFGEQKDLAFRYRLKGLEDTWNETSIPEIRYPKLFPRSYRFEVASIDLNSRRTSPVQVFDIDITPPWYYSRIFGLIVFFLVAWMARRMWTWRVRVLVARQRELEHLVLQRTDELNHRLQQQERLQAEAERANRAKGDFLAMMSHEIRTPMNGVIGMTSMLESTELTDPQLEYVRIIRESGASLLSIINDILDFSKIEAGRLNLENIDFCLLDCIKEPLAVVHHVATRKGINLTLHADPGLPRWLVGDPVRVKQVLLNLLSNAVKFTDHGSVNLRVYQGESSAPEFAHIFFEVKDTGIGISPENQKRLFQSFTQAETSTTRKYGGTGLGLVICRRLVDMIGGQIGVESDIGRGSTFSVSLNLKLSANRNEEKQLAESAVHRVKQPVLESASTRKKILVAEDNIINQKVAMRMLDMLGYQAAVAENGVVALKLLESDHYDAVLMDMHMPLMDGIETTRAIRCLSGALSTIPIIAVTANAIHGERQKCLAAGMNDFITKPIEKDKFAAALKHWTSTEGDPARLSA